MTDLQSFALAHTSELLLGFAAIVITIVLTEVLKPFINLLLVKLKTPTKLEASIIRVVSFMLSAAPVVVLDFRTAWQTMTKAPDLDWASALLLGCSLTWAGAQVAWLLFHDIRPIRAIKVWFYNRIGITQEDITRDD